MAITFVGVTVNGGTGGGAFLAWPTHQTGDLGLLVQECSGDDTPSAPTTGGVPWVLVETEFDIPDATGSQLTVWYRFAESAAEPAPNIPDPGNHQQASIVVFRGVDQSTTVEDSDKARKTVASTTATAPAVVSQTANAMVVAFASDPVDTTSDVFTDSWANANLDSMTLAIRSNTTAGNGGGFAVGYGVLASPGNSGESTIQTGAFSVTNATITLVLRVDGATPPPPDAPTNPAAVAVSSSQIDVSWDDVANETGYRVERSPNGTSGWVDVSGNLAANTTTYQDTGLAASTQYFYRVIAFNAQGDSSPSSTVNATTQAAPAPPVSGAAVLTSPTTNRLARRGRSAR